MWSFTTCEFQTNWGHQVYVRIFIRFYIFIIKYSKIYLSYEIKNDYFCFISFTWKSTENHWLRKKKMDDFKLLNKYHDSFLVWIVSLSEHFDFWSSILCSLTAYFVTFFYSSVIGKLFVDETRIWCTKLQTRYLWWVFYN